MKWRNIDYDVQYAVRRICRELGADPADVSEILTYEFGKGLGDTLTRDEAIDLEEIVLAGIQGPQGKDAKQAEEYLSRKQAADILQIGIEKVDELRREGRLAYCQNTPRGRVLIPRRAIDEFLHRSMHKALPQRAFIETYRKRRAVRA